MTIIVMVVVMMIVMVVVMMHVMGVVSTCHGNCHDHCHQVMMRIIRGNGMSMNDHAHRIDEGSRYGRREHHCHKTCDEQCSASRDNCEPVCSEWSKN